MSKKCKACGVATSKSPPDSMCLLRAGPHFIGCARVEVQGMKVIALHAGQWQFLCSALLALASMSADTDPTSANTALTIKDAIEGQLLV